MQGVPGGQQQERDCQNHDNSRISQKPWRKTNGGRTGSGGAGVERGGDVKRKSALAENLRQILSNEDITVAMLAEWSNVSVHTIKGWLYLDRVARKNSTSLKRVADVLRVGVEELLGRKAREER